MILLLILSVHVSSVPSHVDCDLKVNYVKYYGENIMTTQKQIMGKSPQDDELVLGITPQVCTGNVIDIYLQSIFKKKGILNVTGGHISSKNQQIDEDDCNGRMQRFEDYPSGVLWKAPTHPGSVTFWGATAAGYGRISRGSQTVDVIGYYTDNPLCQGCPGFDNYEDLENGFLLCWSRYDAMSKIQLSYSKSSDNCWIGLGFGSEMIGSNVVIGSEYLASSFYIESKTLNGITPANNLEFSDMVFQRLDNTVLISFFIKNDRVKIDENIVFAYGTQSSSEGIGINKHTIKGTRLIHFNLNEANSPGVSDNKKKLIIIVIVAVSFIVIIILCTIFRNLRKNHGDNYYKIDMELRDSNMLGPNNGKVWL